MQSILEKLWNGTLSPITACGTGSAEVEELTQLMQRNKSELTKNLTPQQSGLFSRYCDCADEYLYFISLYAFREGFCLAAKLMSEAFSSSS